MSETGIETAENVYEGSISGYRRDPYSFDERTFAKAKASFCDMVVAVNDMPRSLMLSIPATVHFANEEAKLPREEEGDLSKLDSKREDWSLQIKRTSEDEVEDAASAKS